jgi:L-alanine-DL-glutamate epimerase-like enolase superfamily enzyme
MTDMKVTVEKLEITTSAPFRSPFKFGAAVMTALTLQEVHLRVSTEQGEAVGLGSMPLGNAWSYPGVPYETSLDVMEQLSARIGKAVDGAEIDSDSVWEMSARLREIAFNEAKALQAERTDLALPIPDLCALVTFSPWDLALFDGWGRALGGNTYDLLRTESVPPVQGYRTAPLDQVLSETPQEKLAIYHVVGGLDALTPDQVTTSPGDGLPDDLQGWMARDGLTHFKIKLQGKDPEWDYQRVAAVDAAVVEQAEREGRSERDLVFSLDLNEQCPSGEVLADLLERLRAEQPRAFKRVAFVEQPTSRAFSGAPEEKVHRAAKLKPVVIDEGLVDVDAMHRALDNGYNGLCLKTCKGMGFSLQMAAVAKGEDLFLCVQDLTCPGMAYLESASLAARVGVDGLEANARQFCPGANEAAALLHPNAFTLKSGSVDATSLDGEGLGMKIQ